MIWAVLKKELLTYLLRLEVPLAGLLVAALALILADSGFREQLRLEKLSRDNEAARARLLEEADSSWSASRAAPPVRHPAPLRPLAMGDQRVQPDVAEARPEGYVFVTNLGADPLPDILPTGDLSFLVGVVLSLLVLLLAHDSITGEREDGTLRLVFTHPISRAQFLLGKWLGGMAGVAIILGTACCAFLLPALLHAPSKPTPDDLASATMLAGVSLLYLAVFHTLALLVSTACDRSSTSLVTLTLLWAVAVLALPNTTPIVARWLVRAPSRMQVKQRIEAARVEELQKYMEARNRAMEKYKDNTQELQKKLQELRDKLEKLNERSRREIMAEVQPRWDELDRTSARLALLSPFAAYTLTASRLCQTDPESREKLDQALKDYEAGVDQYLESFHERNFEQEYDAADMPVFTPPQESFHERLGAVAPRIYVLGGCAMLLFLAGVAVFLRRDVV